MKYLSFKQVKIINTVICTVKIKIVSIDQISLTLNNSTPVGGFVA